MKTERKEKRHVLQFALSSRRRCLFLRCFAETPFSVKGTVQWAAWLRVSESDDRYMPTQQCLAFSAVKSRMKLIRWWGWVSVKLVSGFCKIQKFRVFFCFIFRVSTWHAPSSSYENCNDVFSRMQMSQSSRQWNYHPQRPFQESPPSKLL